MTEDSSPPVERFRYRFTVLLATLALLMVAVPIADALALGSGIHYIATGVIVLTLVAAVQAVSTSRRAVIVTALLALPAIILNGLRELSHFNEAFESPAFRTAAGVCGIVFLGYIIVLSLRHLFRSRRVTTNMISASLCIYLLLGVLWASVYSLIDLVDSQAFIYSAEESGTPRLSDADSNSALYYSFVTMTTLGYGDIVPASPVARMCAVLQAVLGQLYLAVLVARLVGLHIVHATRE